MATYRGISIQLYTWICNRANTQSLDASTTIDTVLDLLVNKRINLNSDPHWIDNLCHLIVINQDNIKLQGCLFNHLMYLLCQ